MPTKRHKLFQRWWPGQ